MGVLEGRVVACPPDGARFDMATGKHITRGHHPGGLAGAAVRRTGMGRLMDAGRTSGRRRFEVAAKDGPILRVIS